MKAMIITIGDELLIGQVLNTNAAFIAQHLNSLGAEVDRIVTVADHAHAILASFEEAYSASDVVVVTGGLGPTHDDITRTAVCRFFRTELVPSAEAREHVLGYLQRRNQPWSDAAENQTLVPRGAVVLPNRHGTAPGELFERDNKVFIVMPGVPYEMEAMMRDAVIPFFRLKPQARFILHRTLKTSGIPESVLAGRLGTIDDIIEGQRLAFLPSPGGVQLRITVAGTDRAMCGQTIRAIENRIRAKIERFIYGTDDEELEDVVGRLLISAKLTIASAESCTGGMVANRLTNVSGSSNYFERGLITYSDKSKTELLRVPPELITAHGAVSREVAEAMANGIRSAAGTDVGISTTGIAGPTGGSVEKPVGLVWIGYADAGASFAIKFHFGDGRLRIKERAAQAALELVRRKLLKLE